MSSADKLCDNCELQAISLYCSDCKLSLCTSCDTEYHLPAKKRNHQRRSRFSQAITDMLIKCEREGVCSEYSSAPQQNIAKYKLEAEDGDWHVFKNGSKDLQLDTEITLTLQNMRCVNFHFNTPDSTRLKLALPPHSVQYIYVQCIDVNEEFSCELSQRFTLKPARVGTLPLLTDADQYTSQTAVSELKNACKTLGSVTEYLTPSGSNEIYQYYYEFSGGYAYLYVNETTDCLFHKDIDFELENLQVCGYENEKERRKFTIDLKPGDSQFLCLKEIDRQKTNKMAMRNEYTIELIG